MLYGTKIPVNQILSFIRHLTRHIRPGHFSVEDVVKYDLRSIIRKVEPDKMFVK